MDPAVAAALIAGGWTVTGALGSQFLAGLREAARDRVQAEREERTQRWDTNRERLIELRALLDNSGVALIACERAVTELRTAVMLREHVGIEVPRDKSERINSLRHELDELEGRLALRVGMTHPVTRSLTLASHAVTDSHHRLDAARLSNVPERESEKNERRAKLADSLDNSQGDARKHQRQFFEEARKLVGVQEPLQDVSSRRALPPETSG